MTAPADELRDLRKRVSKLERLTARDGPLVAALGDCLRIRFEEIEQRRLKFLGIHERGRLYSPGNLVVRSGGLWHCNAETRDTPGKSNSWQLAVKSGEVKKDPTVR